MLTEDDMLTHEEEIIGSVLSQQDGHEYAYDVLEPCDFMEVVPRLVFGQIKGLVGSGKPVSLQDVCSNLDEEIPRYEVAKTLMSPCIPSMFKRHVDLIKQESNKRKFYAEISEITDGQSRSNDEILRIANSALSRMGEEATKKQYVHVRDVIGDSISDLQSISASGDMVDGVPSGIISLDKMTGGFHGGEMVVLAGRPSMGKTALCLNIASYAAFVCNKSVGIFSLEMSSKQLITRIICSESGVPFSRIRAGTITEDEWANVVKCCQQISNSEILIDDTAGINSISLRARATAMNKSRGLDMIIVDYLQLMRGTDDNKSREREIAEISNDLKCIAKEMDIPVIALSQLNRSVESRNDKRPMSSDLRESGSIEQDADLIAFIYRDGVYHPEQEQDGMAEIIVSKQRNGPIGTVHTFFDKDLMRFENIKE